MRQLSAHRESGRTSYHKRRFSRALAFDLLSVDPKFLPRVIAHSVAKPHSTFADELVSASSKSFSLVALLVTHTHTTPMLTSHSTFTSKHQPDSCSVTIAEGYEEPEEPVSFLRQQVVCDGRLASTIMLLFCFVSGREYTSRRHRRPNCLTRRSRTCSPRSHLLPRNWELDRFPICEHCPSESYDFAPIFRSRC